MGTPAAPTIANIYVHTLESLVINMMEIKPLFYSRFIDDVFMVWPAKHADKIAKFFGEFTILSPTISFNPEQSSDKIEFLDLVVYKGTSVSVWLRLTINSLG